LKTGRVVKVTRGFESHPRRFSIRRQSSIVVT
jgi:hypothetical protein